MNVRTFLIRAAVILTALQGMMARSSDVDIDYDAARRAYEAQLPRTASAQQSYNTALAQFQPYVNALVAAQSRLDQAQTRMNAAASHLTTTNNNLIAIQRNISTYQTQDQNLRNQAVLMRRDLATYTDNVNNLQRHGQDTDREIEQLRREIAREQNSANWTCTYVDHSSEEHSGGHRASNANREIADSDAAAACKKLHDTCDSRGCQRTSSQLDQLNQRLQAAQNRRNQINNDIINAQNQVRDAQYRLDQNQQDTVTNQQNLNNAQSQYTQALSERDQAQRDYNDSVNQRDYAATEVTRTQADVNAQRPIVDAAKANLDAHKKYEGELYAYYQQVLKNYQLEKDSASRLGQNSGNQDGTKEAKERSTKVAANDGHNVGATAGKTKGSSDSALKSYVRGYTVGRADGANLSEVATQYQAGLKDGRDQAQRKASLEDLPTGYNDAFAKKLTETPAHSATIDISEQLPSDPGSNGRDLRALHLDVGAVAAPTYVLPKEPLAAVPAPSAPSFQVPAQDNRFAAQPCDGLRTAEFIALCKQMYTSGYAQGYQSSYVSHYKAIFASAFTEAATPAYNEAFAQDHAAEVLRGKGTGAHDLGVLTGFAERLPTAKQEQYAVGAARLMSELPTGHLVVLRTVTLSETSGDGVLQPGEKASLSVVIDNLAQLASPLEKVRLRITNTENAQSLSVQMRGLPSLAGLTRTTLTGVLTAQSSAAFAGDNVSLEGVLELQQDDGTYALIAKLLAKQTAHFPVELVAIEPAAALPIGKWTQVPVKIQNTTGNETAEVKIKLSTKAKDVDVSNPDGLKIPKLAAGETKTFNVSMSPSVRAGGAPSIFSIETIDADNKVVMEQRFRKDISVARNAKLTLLDASGKVSNGSPFVVKAGTSIAFKTRFDFLATTQRGPFTIRYLNASETGIQPDNNSTISVGLGYWSPGTRIDPINFRFRVPVALAGKTAAITIQLEEGSRAIHQLQVPLDIK